VDLGEKRLKDLLHPEHLYQLNRSGLPTSFPALKTLDSFPNNLPIQLTSFIGREREIAEIKQELIAYRLVTLTGSGGTGKTRLSLQVAADLLDQFQHGVWFVELAPLADPDLIPQAILSAIGVQAQQGRNSLDTLKEYLHEKQTLIVLDNCEHLVSASALITNTLLNNAPRLKIMTSSREALGIKGEASYPVPSLSLPDIKHLPIVEQLSHYESVRLFLERATLVAPHFGLDEDNAPFIAQICYRLDGIPLAIELAAARVKMFSVEQISRRLDDRFRLLTGGGRTSLPRQQTLRALVDWSYDILSDHERLLLCRLSVFMGGWTLEAAEEVCSGDGIDSYDVLDLLTQLINKSLIVVVERSEVGETRYRMLETIRQYAREKLLDSGNAEKVRERHFNYFWQMVQQSKLEFYGPKELRWLVWLESEWDNIRAAVEWSYDERSKDGLDLVNCLGHLIYDNWHISDLENWLSLLISRPENSARTASRALGLLHRVQCIGVGAPNENTPSSDAQMMEEGISIYRELDDKDGLAHALQLKGSFRAWMGEPHAGSPFLEEAIALARETNNKPVIARALFSLGFALHTNVSAQKINYMKESLALFRELGYISGMIDVLKQLGAIELRLGNFKNAHAWLDEALSLLQEHAAILGNSKTVSYDVGDLAFYEGNYELAKKCYEDCLSWADRVVSLVSIGYAKVRLGYLYIRLGKLQNAGEILYESLLTFQTAGNAHGTTFTLEGWASLFVVNGQWEKATLLFSYATKQYEVLHGPRPPVEQDSVDKDLAMIHSHLDEVTFDKFWMVGINLTLEDAIALAIKEPR
jgi:predicted ATPase